MVGGDKYVYRAIAILVEMVHRLSIPRAAEREILS